MQALFKKAIFLFLFFPLALIAQSSEELDTWVGQSLFVGISGTKISKSLVSKIKKIRPGGIIFFGMNISNIKSTQKFLSDIVEVYDANNIPRPFLAIDQEGGNVTRIKLSPKLPAPRLLGDANDSELTRKFSELNSTMLSKIGFNMNFAPVLDGGDKYASDFIGSRAFSFNWKEIINNARAQVFGANYARIVSTAKHFPGHGGIKQDSHKEKAISFHTREELFSQDLIPYRELTEQNLLPAIMVGHISYPKIDPSNRPASFSKILVTEILKESLGFKGLIITDDIQMEGANLDPRPGVRAQMAIQAGVDQVMIAWSENSQIEAFFYLKELAQKNQDFLREIKSRYAKIMDLKSKYSILFSFDKRLPSSVPSFDLEWNELFESLLIRIEATEKNRNFLSQFSKKTKAPTVIIAKSKAPYSNFQLGNSDTRFLYFNSKKISSGFSLKRILQKNPNSPTYLFITNQSELRSFLSLSKDLQKKIFAIASTNIKKPGEGIPNLVNTYSYMPEIGYFLSKSKSTGVID